MIISYWPAVTIQNLSHPQTAHTNSPNIVSQLIILIPEDKILASQSDARSNPLKILEYREVCAIQKQKCFNSCIVCIGNRFSDTAH